MSHAQISTRMNAIVEELGPGSARCSAFLALAQQGHPLEDARTAALALPAAGGAAPAPAAAAAAAPSREARLAELNTVGSAYARAKGYRA